MTAKAGHNPNKRNLSKSILGMKFMSRSIAADECESSSSGRDTQWISEHGDSLAKHITFEESYMKLEDLCEIGRITSKQFNPYIEKLLSEKMREKEDGPEEEEEVEEMEGVSAAVMKERYDTLVTNKRRPERLNSDSDQSEEGEISSSRRKFLKPF